MGLTMPLFPYQPPALTPERASKNILKKQLCSKLAVGVFSILVSASLCTQAASTPVTKKNTPTSDIKLISLNTDEVAADNGADDLSDIEDMAQVADQIDDWNGSDDDIDNPEAGSNAPVSGADDDIDTQIPNEVAQVSLNAISPETLKTFVAVVDLVRREYVDTVNDEALFNNAMSGMLTKLDSHAEFLDAQAYENLRAFTQGDVGDIGIIASYQMDVGYWVIDEVIADSPADKADIAVGDYLHQIDEFKLDESKQDNDIKQLLTGIAGTQVDIVTSQAGRRKHMTTLQRNNSHQQNIETRLVEGIAIIKLPVFQNNSREKILTSLTNLEAPVSGILLDVRDNPGGVLTAAVQVASLFMSDSKVVQVKSRDSGLRTLTTRGTAVLQPLPVVILQNRYSASAAEVLASSLQTQKRATIVGETSYGKGSVQSVIPVNDEQAVKLTVAHYLTASGQQIEGIGVQPDVSLTDTERKWEAQALALLRQQVNSAGIRFVQPDKLKQEAIASADAVKP